MSTSAGFNLPDWSMLSAEQESIVNYPENKNYLVQGSPGTGKTVMALYRAATLSKKMSCEIPILVYNNPLKQYMTTATQGSDIFSKVKIQTYTTWITAFYKKYMGGKKVPKVDTFEYIWDEILDDLSDVGYVYKHIIIDEAQDFPIKLLKALLLVSRNVTCFIDPNQAIEANKTNVMDALTELCVESEFTLDTNYRNSKHIAELSLIYWNGEGIEPAAPNKAGPGSRMPVMVKCNGRYDKEKYEDQTEKILKIVRDNKGKNIGILTNHQNLYNIFAPLSRELDGEVEVQMYKSQTKARELDFNKAGVKILSFGTMKGLEFDIVIITRFEKMNATGDEFTDMNRAYVAVTRACNELYILYFGTVCVPPKWANVMPPMLENKNLAEWK